MKRKITKAEFDALAEHFKAYYKADGDNYILQVVGDDDNPAELKRALDRERENNRTLTAANKELKDKVGEVETVDARKKGDIDTLEKSWNNKLETQKTEYENKLKIATSSVNRLLVDNVASKLATELCGENAHLIELHIKQRLTVESVGDDHRTRVLDADGKPSAATLDELKKEFVANPKYKSIIVVSKASGGANGNGTGVSAVPGNKKFHELTEPERVEWYNRDKQGFLQAAAAAKGR